MKILKYGEYNEALVNNKSLDQLRMVRKASKSTDIGDRVSDMNKECVNIIKSSNALDGDVESREDYDNTNKSKKVCNPAKIGGDVC